jgi:hypothetical protein
MHNKVLAQTYIADFRYARFHILQLIHVCGFISAFYFNTRTGDASQKDWLPDISCIRSAEARYSPHHGSHLLIWDVRNISGHAVAQLVEALRYKPEGCGVDSRLCYWNFSLTYSFRPHNGPGID